jgi:ureidoglycolate dehydrogenase (NAD+)
MANAWPAERLAQLMRSALARRGMTAEHATLVVEGLIEPSLRGIDTHGVRLFPTYLAELDGGRSRVHPEMRWLGERAAARVLDAGSALGLVAGRVAAAEAVRLARASGVGAVAVRNSNHFGAASVYTLAMAREGVVGLAFTNSDALVAPHGGIHPLFGTNPLSMAARGVGDDLFCVDMATSQVSYSRVKSRREQGLPLETGWAVTPDGEDAALGDGALPMSALLPLGGHKGQCLGMLVEVLCALLVGMPFDHELSHLYGAPYDEPRQVAHLFLALDVAAFEEPEVFRARLSRLLHRVREQEPAAVVQGTAAGRVLAPGDLEQETERERRQSGIPLTAEEHTFFLALEAQAQR